MENKTLTIIKIVLLSIIAILLILILGVLLIRPRNISFMSFGDNNSKVVFEQEYEEQINSLYVNTSSGDIDVREQDGEKVSVKVYGKNDENLEVKVIDNKLSIVEDGEQFCIGFCFNMDYRIVINVPREREYDIDFSTASGDIRVGDIIGKSVNVKAVSGDITLRDMDNIKVESVSGDITLNNINTLDAKTVSGEIDVTSINNSCIIKTTSGDVEIGDLNVKENSSIGTVSGDVDIVRNNSYIKTNTVSGEADIRNNDRYAEVETTINTTSGDIEVGD